MAKKIKSEPTKIFHIKSISELNQMLGIWELRHPLVTLIREWPSVEMDITKIKVVSELFLISMKGKTRGKALQYGRNAYDFDEGTLIFMAPNQTLAFPEPIEKLDNTGWTLLFHPDLIRKTQLGQTIKSYSFFSYDTNEALHLSNKEKESLVALVHKIEDELYQNIDKHSQDLIVQNIETLLKYSTRYYDRQFYTRANLNKDVTAKFINYLDDYFSSNELSQKGMPSITQCGVALNLSGPYLSNLIKHETGKSAKEYIYFYLIDKAKNLLSNPVLSIKEIAFALGFDYPQHFSKLFKVKTGYSPTEYRNMN